jgi:GNAT superfamily N-acetyltransferase
MNSLEVSNFEIEETEGVFTFKNENTTIGFVRFNEKAEVEYIFVNPIFRKQGLATKLLQLVKQKTGKEIVLQEPISPLGSKLLNSLNKWK